MDDSSGASAAAAPSPSSSQRYPDWAMLVPHNLLLECPKGTLDYSESDDDHFRSTSAHATTSKGELIRVSFHAMPPPEVSRLLVRHTRTRHSLPEKDRWYYPSDERKSLVVAANSNFILLSLGRDRYYSPEIFMYTIGSIVGPRLLPSPYMSRLHHIGIVCDGDTNEFVAADLDILSGDRLRYRRRHTDADTGTMVAEAMLFVFRSSSPRCHWKAMDPPPRIRRKKGQDIELFSWSTDGVVPCGDSLCYVDYFRAVLFLDVLSKCPELRYVRLPAVKVKVPVTDPYNLGTLNSRREHPERSLCATDGGRTVKFIEVVTTTVFI